MIENSNASKMPASGEFVDVPKYVGVASVNIVAINPNNEKLRKYGWNIPEDAEEPVYVTEKMVDGKVVKNARIRFLVEIQEFDNKPIISLDFWCRPEISSNRDGNKFKIIDQFGRTAWATKEDIQAKRVPVYNSGAPANISTPYNLCHSGEEELVMFLMKYLNVTPVQTFNQVKQAWVPSKNPGRLTIDDWGAICKGNITELAKYISMQKENRVKVVLGLRSTEDNKSYQTFLNTGYISNGATVNNNGEYTTARRLIDKYFEGRENSMYSFSAEPVREWKASATEVKDNSGDLFEGQDTTAEDGDLPFS